MDKRPFVAVTIGDIAGIGPEIVVKALRMNDVYTICKPIVIGERFVVEEIIDRLGVEVKVNEVTMPSQGSYVPNTINIMSSNTLEKHTIDYGEIRGEYGKAAYQFILKAVTMAHEGLIDAIATAPINKESLKAGDIKDIGHTEMFARLSNVDDPLTMFEVETMRIFFLTRHVSMKEMIELITEERVFNYIKRSQVALQRLGVQNPTIAVAALNPHAGENGLFGDEERKQIKPAIERAKHLGMKVDGPIPADSVFHKALNQQYDAVLSLYHDQGHIAAKVANFEKTVSITHDLPYLRTSVDHGTAFDIAGRGIASETSMTECIKAAANYATMKKIKEVQ
ncbi:4-hydroxythreonine-4-phosphate dehydrogenase PdxA [Geomicrobium sp. JCM 19038]|uniref:4-hydroxythreonine-4-phosphate dehydrogenase PdxA n=1 Tax=Geomicrobium sp. JCM 19038 TaxID=1460635 RepID=UPI00045F181F|nr:4-hydroxythreonine-4-phosphate dehydrogenase PdxA [Geomicrobium sp. JCM 19038]GAK07082.1 4-hydroxythreonine-4-phosphate dehydrogenase [Geomicrobium sp. JCM 19038]